ncbi:MAG: DegV family protein [Anaerolineae bacterium]
MQIVSDQGADLADAQKAELDIHYVPFQITLNGKTYVSGVDIDNARFYELLSATKAFPTTSQPSPGDFAQVYRKLAKDDPEILSFHISAGLSGSLNSARLAAEMVPEAHVTIIDSRTLSCPQGWQVEAAAKAVRAGWHLDAIVGLIERIRQYADGFFTLSDLRYLIHGGRISHLKGLLATILNIKAVIGVTKDTGIYYTCGTDRTFARAIQRIADTISKTIPFGSNLRVQLCHGNNLEGVEALRDLLGKSFKCRFEDVVQVAPFLGAHTGPSMVGLAFGPLDLYNIAGMNLDR